MCVSVWLSLRSVSVCRSTASKCVWGMERRRKHWWRENWPIRSTLKTLCGVWSLESVWLWVQAQTDSVDHIVLPELAAFVYQLSLSKTSEVWWKAVLKGEKEIDIDQINRERSMATVDEEEHAVLERLTFDYQQKLQGKPQSHEMVRTLARFKIGETSIIGLCNVRNG